jgi:cardiolipin synthase
MNRSLLTIPNALTFLRALGIPLFLYLALSLEADGWAIFVLAVGGATDYFDGKLARAWGQESRFGELADPGIDRLYIVATLVALVLRDAIPLWIVIVLLGRDVILGILTIALKMRGHAPMTVTYLGKAATFNLMYAFPFLLLALEQSWVGTVAFILGWCFAIWGIALYISTGISYFAKGLDLYRHGKRVE